jgi:malate/lactate dehydrogenase
MATSKSTKSQSFWDNPLATIEEALSLRKQIERLHDQLTKTLGTTATTVAEVVMGKKGRKQLSPAARARIGAAQRARWAKVKGKSAVKKTDESAAKAVKVIKKKGGLTPAGRARLAAAMKARWAARKKGAPAPNATARPTATKGRKTTTVYR